MVFHIKTTLNIDDTVVEKLREEAARRATTMSALVEAGLRRILDEDTEEPSRRKRKKLASWKSGEATRLGATPNG